MTGDDAALRTWVAAARDGDADAWIQLYRRSYPRLLAFARRRVAHASADDVVSETMTRALGAIERFTWQGAGFDAWILGICRNVVRERWRERGRERPALAADDAVLDLVDDAPLPVDAAVAADRARELRAAFAALAEDDRELLELRVVLGLTAAEVGEVVGRSAGAVRMAQSRALVRLREQLEGARHV